MTFSSLSWQFTRHAALLALPAGGGVAQKCWRAEIDQVVVEIAAPGTITVVAPGGERRRSADLLQRDDDGEHGLDALADYERSEAVGRDGPEPDSMAVDPPQRLARGSDAAGRNPPRSGPVRSRPRTNSWARRPTPPPPGRGRASRRGGRAPRRPRCQKCRAHGRT